MITKTIVLPCSPVRAFELFTQHASEWWPPERRHTSDPTSTIMMVAPAVRATDASIAPATNTPTTNASATNAPAATSGRFFERSADGREVELGRVLAWRPGEQLVLEWFPGTDSEHPTRVVVTFEAIVASPSTRVDASASTPVDASASTRITIEHGPTPASDSLYPSRAPRYAASWDMVLAALDRYALEHR